MTRSTLKLREDCQLNLEKLKQHCKKEVKVLKEVSSNPHCSRYLSLGKLETFLAPVQGCCADPNGLWDEEVQEKECPDVKRFHLCCQSKEKIVMKKWLPGISHLGGASGRLYLAPAVRPNSCCWLALTSVACYVVHCAVLRGMW